MEWLLPFVGPALVLGALVLSWMAGRLDRLHHRVEKASAVLDAALFHRSGTVVEIASAKILDPAASLLLLDAAHRARASTDEEREPAESDLSRALLAALADADQVRRLRADPSHGVLIEELSDACRTVELSRRFHNDVAAAARELHGRVLVRWFRLSGHAAPPRMVELDDSWPPALS
ncbi:MAG: hypothetical protein GEU96_17640 [Propionibacteriales bacterium]|nr:hypothetical protein [Propionibacteriales bacterium]